MQGGLTVAAHEKVVHSIKKKKMQIYSKYLCKLNQILDTALFKINTENILKNSKGLFLYFQTKIFYFKKKHGLHSLLLNGQKNLKKERMWENTCKKVCKK